MQEATAPPITGGHRMYLLPSTVSVTVGPQRWLEVGGKVGSRRLCVEFITPPLPN